MMYISFQRVFWINKINIVLCKKRGVRKYF